MRACLNNWFWCMPYSDWKLGKPRWLRLAIWMILNCKEDNFLAVFATCCSSWVHVNTGTSKRSLLLPEGATNLDYIGNSNKMVARWFSTIRSIMISAFYFFYVHAHIDACICMLALSTGQTCDIEHGWFSIYDFPCIHVIPLAPKLLYTLDLICPSKVYPSLHVDCGKRRHFLLGAARIIPDEALP